MCDHSDDFERDKCRIAVTVEDISAAPCHRKIFDIEIRDSDGETAAKGKAAAGDTVLFDLPCENSQDSEDSEKHFSVTVSGGKNSSPRAQTKRIHCCCGKTSAATFVFDEFEPECTKCPSHYQPPSMEAICICDLFK